MIRCGRNCVSHHKLADTIIPIQPFSNKHLHAITADDEADFEADSEAVTRMTALLHALGYFLRSHHVERHSKKTSCRRFTSEA